MANTRTNSNSKSENKEKKTSAKKPWVRPLVLFCVAVLFVSGVFILRGTAGDNNKGSSITGEYTKEDIDNLYQEYLEILDQKRNEANDAIVPDNASPSNNSAKDNFIEKQEEFANTSTDDLAKNAQSMLESMKPGFFGDANGSDDVLDSDASTEPVQDEWNAEEKMKECQDLLAQLTGNN